jgi:hypothetical protein
LWPGKAREGEKDRQREESDKRNEQQEKALEQKKAQHQQEILAKASGSGLVCHDGGVLLTRAFVRLMRW